jgi:hypothetical protein
LSGNRCQHFAESIHDTILIGPESRSALLGQPDSCVL